MSKKIKKSHDPSTKLFPWLGYFESIDNVDIFVFLDDVPLVVNQKE